MAFNFTVFNFADAVSSAFLHIHIVAVRLAVLECASKLRFVLEHFNAVAVFLVIFPCPDVFAAFFVCQCAESVEIAILEFTFILLTV